MRTAAVAVAAWVAMGGVAAADSNDKPNGSPALSVKQLQAIMPKLSDERAATFIKPLNNAMREFEITTPKRRAAFLAQIAHESGELRYMEELMSGEKYENRPGLGNTQPGDGKRYKGRGPIQLTGRANYRNAGFALRLDLENKPELAAQPDVGCRIAGWFWKANGLNELADAGDFRTITKRINGGYHGQEQRLKYYHKAKEVLRVRE
jgi:putative chitinase